jgi:hypothetical protein
MSNVRSWRITVEYSTIDPKMTIPDKWDWFDLIAPDTLETMTLVDVQEIPTPEAHDDDFHDRKVYDEAL